MMWDDVWNSLKFYEYVYVLYVYTVSDMSVTPGLVSAMTFDMQVGHAQLEAEQRGYFDAERELKRCRFWKQGCPVSDEQHM